MEKPKNYDRNFKIDAVNLGLEKNFFKAAKELCVPTTNIYRWRDELKKYGTESFCRKNGFRNIEEKRFSELKRTLKKKLAESELHVEIFKLARQNNSLQKPMIFHFIENNLDKYPLWRMCQALGIIPTTYHNWKNNLISPRQRLTTVLEQEITSIFYEFNEIYGNIKISAELQSRGVKLSASQVTCYMRKLGLTSKISSKHNSKYNSPYIPYNPCVFPNVLNRQFKVSEPSQVWVSGITSIETESALAYLTIVMDLFDRKIIGWSLSNGLTIKETSIPAWEMAVHNRKTKKGLIFHSDRGPQYANKVFTRKLNSNKHILRSMSRQGNHLDNHVPKIFFTSLKSELANLKVLLTKTQIEEKIFKYIENLS